MPGSPQPGSPLGWPIFIAGGGLLLWATVGLQPWTLNATCE
eukprot:SAG22_NODE_1113_length_5533_cov_5.884063_11_plen_41_part_00